MVHPAHASVLQSLPLIGLISCGSLSFLRVVLTSNPDLESKKYRDNRRFP